MVEISKNIISNNELQLKAAGEDWDKLWVILVAHCTNRLIYRYGQKARKEDLLRIVDEKISDVLTLVLVDGKRKWNIDEYPTLKHFLIGVIDSHLNNTFNKSKSKEELAEELPENSKEVSPENEIVYQELRKEVYDFLVTDKASDEELLIFECMADGITKPKAIKEDLGISETDFHNAWRRLKPKLFKVRRKLSIHER